MINVSHTRPLGITIITVVVAIFGVIGIISGIVLMGTSVASGVITLVLGILELGLAWGLWTLQRWAFWTTVILEVLALLNGLFAFTQRNVSGAVIDVVIALIILIYLFADPHVRAAFRT